MARTRRSDVILMDSARKAARRMLADQVAATRTGLSPHRLATLWRAAQVRRIESATQDVALAVRANRGLVAAGLAMLGGLIAAPLLLRGVRRRNAKPETRIEEPELHEGADHDR